VSWFLIVVLTVTALGHLCVLPFHSHDGATAEAAHSGGGAHEHDSAPVTPEHDAFHAASCDAVSTSGSRLRPVTAATLIPIAGGPGAVIATVPRPAYITPLYASPPLFVLHASLLI
jgi:hypothetical protein